VTREPSPVIRDFDGFPLPCHLRALGPRNRSEVESQRSAAARSTLPWKSRGFKLIKARLPRPEVLGFPSPLGQGMRPSSLPASRGSSCTEGEFWNNLTATRPFCFFMFLHWCGQGVRRCARLGRKKQQVQ